LGAKKSSKILYFLLHPPVSFLLIIYLFLRGNPLHIPLLLPINLFELIAIGPTAPYQVRLHTWNG